MRDLKSCRVLVTPTTYGKSDPRLRAELEAAVGEVIYNQLGRPHTSAELRDIQPGIDGYIAGQDTIDRLALGHADRLKVSARSGVGVEKIVLAAVRAGHLAEGAVGVCAPEPLPCGHPCLGLPQIITTPHCASHTDDAMDAMGWGALRACLAVLAGAQPEHRVFPKTPNPPYKISKKTIPTMYFIGVDTAKSSIMKVFPLWMQELGRPEVVLEGLDFKLHDDPEKYATAVAQIKYDPLSLGALVTSHKITLFEAARDMFDYVDPYAVTCGEVSSISKNGSALEGHAKDPISAGLSLDSLLGKDYFTLNGGHVLCFGAGGSTTAIILYFAHKRHRGDRPERVVVVNRSPGRLEHLKAMIAGLNTDIQFEYHCNNDPEINDSYMSRMPPASLVINATGMGKDLPGSPITGHGPFPEGGIAWELNYRGELGFLHQALAQAESRRLTIEDGWLYFLHGWAQVIAQVLKVNIDDRMLKRLAEVAGRVCTPALPQRVVGGVVSEPAS
jgi:shikimate 5-dehydrogenase